MAKRVAAQRRGLLYGLIAVIGVAAIMTGLFVYEVTELQKIYAKIDPTAKDMQTADLKLENTRRKLQGVGVLPSGQSTSLAQGVDELLAQNNLYEQAIGKLVVGISSKQLEKVRGEALTSQVNGQERDLEAAKNRAAEALKITPQAGVENVEAKAPPSLVAAIDELIIHVKALNVAYKAKEDRIKSLEANNQTLETKITTVQQTLDAKLKEAAQEAATRIAALEDKIKEVQAQADQFEKERDATRDAGNKALTAKNADIQKLNNEIALLNSKLDELGVRIQRALARELEPDGKIVRIAPGERTGYINLGKGDGVFNGLTFAVLDPAELGKEIPQPKGRIRITNVMDDSSEFAIEQVLVNMPIVEQDLIANAAFDRERPFRFTVVGRFDINGDGVDDTGLIKDLVRRFGGVVDEKVSVETDYLVAGKDPMSAMPATAGASPQQDVIIKKLQEEQKAFGEATDLARRLHVPVLTQNRFLSLIGFQLGKAR